MTPVCLHDGDEDDGDALSGKCIVRDSAMSLLPSDDWACSSSKFWMVFVQSRVIVSWSARHQSCVHEIAPLELIALGALY